MPREFGVRQVPESGRPAWVGDFSGSPRPSAWAGEFSALSLGMPAEPRNIWTPPKWLDEAWEQMASRQWLGHAVAAYYEGLRLHREHPSMALVAFVSVVESVSNYLFDVSRCSECRSHLHVVARFRAVLRLVVSDDDADQLGAAYSPRSLTVHEAHLHGSDTSASSGMGPLWNDPYQDFDWVVHNMRRASAELLIRALRGRLPDRRGKFNRNVDPWDEKDRTRVGA